MPGVYGAGEYDGEVVPAEPHRLPRARELCRREHRRHEVLESSLLAAVVGVAVDLVDLVLLIVFCVAVRVAVGGKVGVAEGVAVSVL